MRRPGDPAAAVQAGDAVNDDTANMGGGRPEAPTDLAAWIAEKRAASAGATEGPWIVNPFDDCAVMTAAPDILLEDQSVICEIMDGTKADARHIAAFPPATTRRLLDAAEVLAAFVEKVEAGKARSTDTYNRAKAALDALRGGGGE